MVKRVDSIKQRSELARRTARGFVEPLIHKKCTQFLEEHFKNYAPSSDNDQTVLDWLEKLHNAARPLAIAISAEQARLEARVPDSGITPEEMLQDQRQQMLALMDHANSMLIILRANILPFRVTAHHSVTELYRTKIGTAGERVITDNLTERLQRLIKELEENLPTPNMANVPSKRGAKANRREIISSLAGAWREITGKEPEPRKVDIITEKPYGEFADYLEAGRQFIVGQKINFSFDISEAIDETNRNNLKQKTDC